jgi:ABC-2 type transport system permease protein
MDRGHIRVCGTLTELQETLQLSERYQVWVNEFSEQKINTLENNLPGVSIKIISQSEDRNESVFNGDRATCLEFYNLPEHDSLNNVLDQLRLTDCIILNVAQIFPSLEQIFSHHTELFDQNALYPTQIPDHTTIPAKPSTIPANEHVGITIKRKHSKASFALIAKAFLIRDYLDESSYRVAFVIQLLNIVFSVGVFYFISLLVGDSAEPYLSDYGGDYFSFVLIGIAFSGYFGVGLSSFSNRLRQAQTTGTLEAMLATPARLSEIIISSSLWEYIMTTLRVVVYLAVGVLLMNANLNGNIFAATVILILTIITFSSLGIISASFVMVLKRGDPVAWAFSAVSTLLGGVYYPITILPDWLQMLARLLPITYALEGMRLALLQDASVNEILPQIVALIIFSVILLPGSLFSFRYAVKRAKIEGSLTHY